MTDEITSMLELPPSARALSRTRSAYRRFAYEVRHPENHKQLIRFLCVGASGFAVNIVAFFILIHSFGSPDKVWFWTAAFIGAPTTSSGTDTGPSAPSTTIRVGRQ